MCDVDGEPLGEPLEESDAHPEGEYVAPAVATVAVTDGVCVTDGDALGDALDDCDAVMHDEYVTPTVTTVALGECVCDTDGDALAELLTDWVERLVGVAVGSPVGIVAVGD